MVDAALVVSVVGDDVFRVSLADCAAAAAVAGFAEVSTVLFTFVVVSGV